MQDPLTPAGQPGWLQGSGDELGQLRAQGGLGPSNLEEAQQPENRLIGELSHSNDPDVSALRVSLAIGSYLLGRLDLSEARKLSGQPPERFDQLVTAARQPKPESAPATDSRPMISVILPVLNEQPILAALHQQLSQVLKSLGTHEIIFVDDGSSDASPDTILALRQIDPSVKLLQLSRNFGHQAALSAGLDHAQGSAVVFMDADLQDPPQLLAEFVRQWQAGHEVVYAVRTKRKEGALKRLCYFLFYRLLRRVARIDVPLDSGDFCLIDRRVADALRGLRERSRFLRGLRAWTGFQQVGVPCERSARYSGDPKYSFAKLVKLGLDGLLAFSSLPLRLGSYLGFLTAGAGVAYIVVALVAKVAIGHTPAGWTSIIAIILTLGGVQLLLMGLLGEYLARVYEETKHRPLYIVDQYYGITVPKAD